jgi:O-antigen ligase
VFYQGIGQSPQHYFHSSYALVLFGGGLVGLALLTCWSYLVLRGVAGDGRAVTAVAPTVLLLVYGLTEVVWNPVAFDGLSWMFVAVLCTGSCRRPDAEPLDDLTTRIPPVDLVKGTSR